MNRSHRRSTLGAALATILVALVAIPAVVLAGKPVKGAVYTGAFKRENLSLSLAVSANGKDFEFLESFPPLYCQGGAGGLEEIPKLLKIAKKGTFGGTISYRVIHGKVVAKLTVKGKFAGSKATGTAHSDWLLTKGCNGTSAFTATAGATGTGGGK